MRGVILFALAMSSLLRAQEAAPSPSPKPADLADAPATDRRTVEHDGQVFSLASSTAIRNVATDEYTVAGEKIAAWTQLVTVQRLTLSQATDADAFVAYFKQRIADDGATLDVLSPGRTASVFSVRFPKSERNEEQVMVCLVMADPAEPCRLHIVQYAIKPLRFPIETTAARLKSWRDKFVAQAHAAGVGTPAP